MIYQKFNKKTEYFTCLQFKYIIKAFQKEAKSLIQYQGSIKSWYMTSIYVSVHVYIDGLWRNGFHPISGLRREQEAGVIWSIDFAAFWGMLGLGL